MKAKAINEISFKPVILEITFESQEELDNFGKVFNNGRITAAFKRLGIDCKIWRAIEQLGGNISHTNNVLQTLKDEINR